MRISENAGEVLRILENYRRIMGIPTQGSRSEGSNSHGSLKELIRTRHEPWTKFVAYRLIGPPHDPI